MKNKSAIGVFDSGFGGLTVLNSLRKRLPDYDFIYFGDNDKAPYGNRSFEEVYQFTKHAVQYLFDKGCPLVILACNTASAKALRSIQQNDLMYMGADKRVLGVIRPSAEIIGSLTKTGHIGLLATQGTVQSNSYALELQKFFPDISLTQFACPRWVPLIENGTVHSLEGLKVIKEDIQSLLEIDGSIDTILLGCTHYPIIQKEIQEFVGENIQVVAQGDIVANSLVTYLSRHPEFETKLSKSSELLVLTSGDTNDFSEKAKLLLGENFEVFNI